MSTSTKPSLIYSDSFQAFYDLTKSLNPSKCFTLVDPNTKKYCLPLLEKNQEFSIIEIPSGEAHKNLETLSSIWQSLTDLGADRSSILINLGGGVITDMGGFAASCFKRGMRFINIPTTLLSMIDASIGGKTGVDFDNLKNQIGLFSNPEAVIINPKLLETLPKREVLSGLAEVIKYGLIADLSIWNYITNTTNFSDIPIAIILKSIEIKQQIVKQDPKEKGIRKTLNFGHTLGHAVETHFMSKPEAEQLLHGEAVAVGMLLVGYLSYKTRGFSKEKSDTVRKTIRAIYKNRLPRITDIDLVSILELLKHDKKNSNGKINFILLDDFGKAVIDCHVEKEAIVEAFGYYGQLL